MRRIQKWGIALAAITAGTQLNTTEACTRVVYQGKDNLFLIVICTFISSVILCFCFGLFCDYIEEPLATVREKSIQYVKGQLGETLPVFLVFLIMTVMSTICVSVLEVKQHIRNLYIYRIVGIDKVGCFRIQKAVAVNRLMCCLMP